MQKKNQIDMLTKSLHEELTNTILPQEVDFSVISSIKEIIHNIAEIKSNQLFLELEMRQALDIENASTQKQGIAFNSEDSLKIDIGEMKSLCGELNVFGFTPLQSTQTANIIDGLAIKINGHLDYIQSQS